MNANLIEELIEKARDYSKTSFDLFKLRAVDKSSEIISSAVTGVFVAVVFLMVLFFVNIGVALWLGELLGKSYYGFFGVAVFYIITGIVFYIFRDKWIKNPVRNSIIRRVFD